MLPRRLRLSRASFPRGREGLRASSPFFTIVTGPSKDGGCAVVVSKAVAKKATARHRIKRQLLSILSPWCTKDRFLVVYAKKGIDTPSFKALQEELTGLLSKTLR